MKSCYVYRAPLLPSCLTPLRTFTASSRACETPSSWACKMQSSRACGTPSTPTCKRTALFTSTPLIKDGHIHQTTHHSFVHQYVVVHLYVFVHQSTFIDHRAVSHSVQSDHQKFIYSWVANPAPHRSTPHLFLLQLRFAS